MEKKNARQPKPTSAETKRNSIPGNLPKRINTVLAGVLASLIEGRAVTGMDAVFKQHTTRAAAVIHYLEVRYRWTIERRDIATGTNDGRVAWVSVYWLTAQTREAAFAVGASAWIGEVKAAAHKRRKQRDAVKVSAAKLNARRSDPRQRDFWEGV